MARNLIKLLAIILLIDRYFFKVDNFFDHKLLYFITINKKVFNFLVLFVIFCLFDYPLIIGKNSSNKQNHFWINFF